MSRRTWIAIGQSLLPGVGFVVLAGWTATRAAWPSPFVLAFWLGILLAARHGTLPWGARRIDLRDFVTFAALLVLGVAPTAWLVFLSEALPVLPDLVRTRRLALRRRLAAAAVASGTRLAILGSTGVVFTALGGSSGGALASRHLVPLACAGVTYLLVQALADWATALPALRQRLWRARDLALPSAWGALQLCGSVAWALLAPAAGATALVLLAVPLVLAAIGHARWQQAARGHLEAVQTLMAAVDAADPMTRGQSTRIAKMSTQVGRRLGLGPEAIAELEYAALLHEVGRSAIQRELMFKPAALDNQEQAVMRTHPRLGSEVVQRFGFFPGAAAIVHAHHEQPDGRGYPQGLRADAIPLGSAILMATAAFDAMTSDRPYRRGLTPEAAVERLLALAGHQFFSDVVEALIDLYTSGELFDHFDPLELERYAHREGGSRLLQEHLRRRGVAEAATAPTPAADDVPTLELPALPRPDVVRQEFDVGGALRVQVAALSDVGCTREHNEDAFGIFTCNDARGCLLVVADGMGGAAAGEVASRLAVESIHVDYFATASATTCGDALRQAMLRANAHILAQAESASDLVGMGTTCTAAVLAGGELVVGHVGDSRAYLLRDRTIEILTRDHTLAAELQLVAGTEGPAEARNVLTRCLGTRAEVDIDLARPVPLQDGDILVLCSDGLHGQLPVHEIRAIVQGDSPSVACTRLLERALERGAPDNVSVVVARVRAA